MSLINCLIFDETTKLFKTVDVLNSNNIQLINKFVEYINNQFNNINGTKDPTLLTKYINEMYGVLHFVSMLDVVSSADIKLVLDTLTKTLSN